MTITAAEQKLAARAFAERWKGKGDEKQQAQSFWQDLLKSVYGIDNPTLIIEYEKTVKFGGTTKFIDGYIASTRVLIEQKGQKIDLSKPERQSDGTELTPYEQGKRYAGWLPVSEQPRWIVVSNFQTFEIHDQEDPNGEPLVIALEDLPKAFNSLSFLVNLNETARKVEMDISFKAGTLIGKLYDALLKQYGAGREKDPETLKSLNKLCVRIVFCLYAEDSGVFPIKDQFGKFIRDFLPENTGDGLEKLFKVLNTKKEDRKASLPEKYAAFPYVNGGLFADDEDDEIPPFNDEVREILLNECSEDFDWSQISPTIFGAMFESTLNPETRRSGGMHYTSIENIHKVIDPLFLNDLKAELQSLLNDDESKYGKRGRDKLRAFQQKLASLKFLDPACGSGNFLTETYICLRRLENETLRHLSGDMSDLFLSEEGFSPVQVQLKQFYGIEINDFAVTVAKTALWIAESQLLQETEQILHRQIDFLPLKTYTNITEGNALRLDWNEIVPASELNYIMGNPPFLGYSHQSKEQKDDMLSLYVDENGKGYKNAGKIDYVSGWYFKAAQMMQQQNAIRSAFVSTNSITQGDQVAYVWKPLFKRFGIHIDFAWRTFVWNSEAAVKAHVHCVIVGFSVTGNKTKKLYSPDGAALEAKNISPYLVDSTTALIENRSTPLCDAPEMCAGNRPADGGNLIIEDEDLPEFLAKEPGAKKYVKRFMGADEFINNKPRWCLWLVGVPAAELRELPLVMQRVQACKEDRLKGAEDRQKLAATPTLMREQLNPDSFVIVPCHTSESRTYIPLGFQNADVIAGNANLIIPSATIYHFGILTSSVHMAWMRAIAGRIKSDYRYSKDIVYNNFIWPEVDDAKKEKIEKCAQAILDARVLPNNANCSLADLYDPLTMPPELLKAHQANDKAVLDAYGFKKDIAEPEIVARLMELYAQKTASQS